MLPSDKPVISPIIVGRDQEVGFLASCLEEARTGRGRCVAVSGEAGVGKSRLVDEVSRQAEQLNFAVFRGTCFESDLSFPFAAVVEGLRAAFAGRNQGEIGQVVGALGPELIKLVPELGVILPGIRPSPPLEPAAEGRRLFEVLTRFLWQYAGKRPLFVALEDLHWGDNRSLDFVYALARRLQDRPALLLFSYRLSEANRLGSLLARLNRDRLAGELVLGPLGPDDTELMVQAKFGVSQPVRRDVVRLLYGLTGGNPFFIEEVLKGWVSAGSVSRTAGGLDWAPPGHLAVPRNVHEAVRQRLPRLDNELRTLLSLAAVAGQRFNLATICELSGRDAAAVLTGLDGLAAAQLVVEVSPENFAFRHPLTRDAVYSGLRPSELRTLHRRMVDVLAKAGSRSPEGRVGELAYHCYAGGLWEKALEFSARAAERASALYAPQEAAEHLNRAVLAAHQLGIFPPPGILRARGKARETLGHAAEAGRDYEAALQAARASEDRLAEWQALLDLGILWAARDQQVAGSYIGQALALARELEDPALLAQSLNAVGDWYAQTGNPGPAIGLHEEALARFETLGDEAGVAWALNLLGMASQLQGDLIRARDCFERSADLFRRLGNLRGLASALTNLSICGGGHQHDLEVAAMGLDRAVAVGEEAVRVAREIYWGAGEAFALAELTLRLILRGDYRRAQTLGEAALKLAEDIGEPQWIVAACRSLGRLYLDLLAWEQARNWFERAYQLLARLGSGLWEGYVTAGLAVACIGEGELECARSLLCRVLAPELPAETRWQRQMWGAAAELALAENKPELALEITARLKASTRNLSPGAVVPRLWVLQATALTRLRRLAEAEALLLEAGRWASDRGLPGWSWRIHLGFGLVYRAWGRRKEAGAELLEAGRIVRELAAGLTDGDVRAQFVGRATGTIPPVRGAEPKRAGLTAREWQVARLISQGKSNREIAEELFISGRTVESHVASIMTRLKLASRAGIAAWAVRQERESDRTGTASRPKP
jgi:DNA-binding CsgD family transcriptional regulator/tetratricopeptide (TPR) repeat protein